MKKTNTSEKGFEDLIVHFLVTQGGYIAGDPLDYDRAHAVDLVQLKTFFANTQPHLLPRLGLDGDPVQNKFLHRLQGEISKRGIVDVLRRGMKHHADHVDLYYSTPSHGNAKAQTLFESNIFSITRQLKYSPSGAALALDMAIFINGLPVATFELKNTLTKQTVLDAVQQYKRDRDPKELLFEFGRCLAHFALDDQEVRFCTHLQGKSSWFLPFNQGFNDGAGNPPNPNGIKTAYFWQETLSRAGLTEIIENYAQMIVEKDDKTGKKRKKQIFPRFHQLSVVRKLLADVRENGVGKRYLIQHSAGSGKSNSIAWLAHQLGGLEKDQQAVFDSVIVVTDRRILDKQIQNTIKNFAQVNAAIGHAERASDLRDFLSTGKKIIISTVQKFPFILDAIGKEKNRRHFAIIIDEAHSSQGGKTSSAMNQVLTATDEEAESVEDQINQIMAGRKMLKNASYFAFTATPKNKTLEIFGRAEAQPDGKTKHLPFHSYTMKQAIEEGFILDVLKSYTPIKNYYLLAKKIEEDPLFDAKKAQKKLRRYVEGHKHAIYEKAEMMIEHFHSQVKYKINGKARAMIVTSGILRAIDYFHAVNQVLKARKSPFQAVIAFSGEVEYSGAKVTEASLNGFPSSQISNKITENPYRFLIVADKFLTGYDQPLMQTMYVDKPLSGIKAVQTLSRLNRAHPAKYDTFILDFYNDLDTICAAFEPYYRTTILSDETDPNKLHDLQADLDHYCIYSATEIDTFLHLYFAKSTREKLDPLLDICVARYNVALGEDEKIDFKGKAKSFCRLYGFLAAVLPYSYAEWEKRAIFLNFLIPKLPAPQEDDLSRGILEAIDMDSYRVELQQTTAIKLSDDNGEIDPIPVSRTGQKTEAELLELSQILQTFNNQFGNIEWQDVDKIRQIIMEELPIKVAADSAYQNAIENNDRETARLEHDRALTRVMVHLLKDHTELFKQFSDNPSFNKWLSDMVFNATYLK